MPRQRADIHNMFTAAGLGPGPDPAAMTSSRPLFRAPSRALLALLLAGSLLPAVPAAAFQPQDSAGFRRASPPPRPPQGREVSDQEHARYQRESGQNRSFEELFRRASGVGRGEYLGVEPDISRNIYRFKFMRPGGNVVWVDMDGRTGRVIAERD